MYEAMGTIGYQAGAIGNHDVDFGADHLRKCEALAKMPLLCANYLGKDGAPCFPPSKIFDVDGVRVGVIGITVPKKAEGMLEIEATGQAVAREAERLEPEAQLLVVVAHAGMDDCKAISALAPAVDIFVGGHTHELLREPEVVEGTGALIVQAGQYAEHVGRLELTIDLDTEKIVQAAGCVVPMDHATASCDAEMLAWAKAREEEVCPDADKIIGQIPKSVGTKDLSWMSAEALRRSAGVDIGLCLGRDVMRDSLPAGPIEVNALFRTGGQRGCKVATAELSGAMIDAYQNALLDAGDGASQWVGFHGRVRLDKELDKRVFRSDLDAAHTYRVAITEREWDRVKNRLRQSIEKTQPAWAETFQSLPEPAPCTFSFTEALTAFVQGLTDSSTPIETQGEALEKAYALAGQ
jgi:2',3'-cyclic-nucleotide 2'-phosphodiesterase (5'-nucleotidase family)